STWRNYSICGGNGRRRWQPIAPRNSARVSDEITFRLGDFADVLCFSSIGGVHEQTAKVLDWASLWCGVCIGCRIQRLPTPRRHQLAHRPHEGDIPLSPPAHPRLTSLRVVSNRKLSP